MPDTENLHIEKPRVERSHLDASQGERLSADAYRQDFRGRRWVADGRDSWKLERQQDFQEPKNESWQAFSQGDWSEAVRLIEQTRDSLLKLSATQKRTDPTSSACASSKSHSCPISNGS